MTSMKFNVQNTVHLLPVPFEIAEVINGFLFIQIENFIKKKKSEISQIIKQSSFTRKSIYTEDELFWDVQILSYTILNTGYTNILMPRLQSFQAMNCGKCGNYINMLRYTKKKGKNIMCSCHDLIMYT